MPLRVSDMCPCCGNHLVTFVRLRPAMMPLERHDPAMITIHERKTCKGSNCATSIKRQPFHALRKALPLKTMVALLGALNGALAPPPWTGSLPLSSPSMCGRGGVVFPAIVPAFLRAKYLHQQHNLQVLDSFVSYHKLLSLSTKPAVPVGNCGVQEKSYSD
jgi:hypothetical protein